jgi:hypothetical protein
MREYTRRPTTTVGNAMRLLSTARSARLPRKRFSAMRTARGMPGMQAITEDARANLSEVQATNQTSGSPEMSR